VETNSNNGSKQSSQKASRKNSDIDDSRVSAGTRSRKNSAVSDMSNSRKNSLKADEEIKIETDKPKEAVDSKSGDKYFSQVDFKDL